MDIVVNDTNIFIDLMSIGLLEETFKLPMRFHTVDYIVHEIVEEQQNLQIQNLIERKLLYVKEFDSLETFEIVVMHSQQESNVSIPDCSVWYYAKKNNYRLLTGDKALRTNANTDGVLVSGILFLTDKMVENGLVSAHVMAEKLQLLYQINKRLPKKAIDERITKYKLEGAE